MNFNGPYAVERRCGKNSSNYGANDALGHVNQRKFKFGSFVYHVPVRHLLFNLTSLYHVIAQLQTAHSLPQLTGLTNLLTAHW